MHTEAKTVFQTKTTVCRARRTRSKVCTRGCPWATFPSCLSFDWPDCLTGLGTTPPPSSSPAMSSRHLSPFFRLQPIWNPSPTSDTTENLFRLSFASVMERVGRENGYNLDCFKEQTRPLLSRVFGDYCCCKCSHSQLKMKRPRLRRQARTPTLTPIRAPQSAAREARKAVVMNSSGVKVQWWMFSRRRVCLTLDDWIFDVGRNDKHLFSKLGRWCGYCTG